MRLERDTSNLGTVVGILVVAVAVVGTTVLDWEWGQSNDQLLPILIGVVAAAAAVTIAVRMVRN